MGPSSILVSPEQLFVDPNLHAEEKGCNLIKFKMLTTTYYHISIYTYIHTYIHIYMCVYIYIYIEREREIEMMLNYIILQFGIL